MDRRIFGIETEYGVTAATRSGGGERPLNPDEIARHMFRSVVATARSSNVFLRNGARLYLDVGNHPEYATAECDDLRDLIAQDCAGEAIIADLVAQAAAAVAEQGIDAELFAFKNNVDSAGNSYGCHENYLLDRRSDLASTTATLLPFLMTRQLICGAGQVLTSPAGAPEPRKGSAAYDRIEGARPVGGPGSTGGRTRSTGGVRTGGAGAEPEGRVTIGLAPGEPPAFVLSQRAHVMWEGVSSATTRARPMINTRDEPHADAERYRRLHVIVGDSNMSQMSTLLKLGSADLVLRAIEAGATIEDLTPANQPAAIRAFSRDLTGRATVRTVGRQDVSALDVQRRYRDLAAAHVEREGYVRPTDEQVLTVWTEVLDAIEAHDLDRIAHLVDWAIKWRMISRFMERSGAGLDDPRVARLDLTYHDIDRERGLFHRLEARGAVATVVDGAAIDDAKDTPPQTTRAKLRGRFVAAASEAGRDFTVDWSHLRLNDDTQRTILCNDPLAAEDSRVDALIDVITAARD